MREHTLLRKFHAKKFLDFFYRMLWHSKLMSYVWTVQFFFSLMYIDIYIYIYIYAWHVCHVYHSRHTYSACISLLLVLQSLLRLCVRLLWFHSWQLCGGSAAAADAYISYIHFDSSSTRDVIHLICILTISFCLFLCLLFIDDMIWPMCTEPLQMNVWEWLVCGCYYQVIHRKHVTFCRRFVSRRKEKKIHWYLNGFVYFEYSIRIHTHTKK